MATSAASATASAVSDACSRSADSTASWFSWRNCQLNQGLAASA